MILNPLPLETVVDRRVALEIAGGAGIGALIGGAFCGWWHWQGRGTSVAVLGAGSLLSVLITHRQRRILFAAATDPVKFTTMVGSALPSITRPLDLVLIDPRSHADVPERVGQLGASEVYWLPDAQGGNFGAVWRSPTTISTEDGFTVAVDPGSSGAWNGLVEYEGERLIICPGEPDVADRVPAVISLAGPISAPAGWQLAIAPFESGDDDTVRYVADGQDLKLRLNAEKLWIEA